MFIVSQCPKVNNSPITFESCQECEFFKGTLDYEQQGELQELKKRVLHVDHLLKTEKITEERADSENAALQRQKTVVDSREFSSRTSVLCTHEKPIPMTRLFGHIDA